MGTTLRLTYQTRLVLRALSENPLTPRYGLDISKQCGLPVGTIYPLLARLEHRGLLASAREEIDASKEGRPPRRHYWLTAEGAILARQVVEHTSWPKWNLTPDPKHAGGEQM